MDPQDHRRDGSAGVSRTPTEAFRNPRTPGRRRKAPNGEPEAPRGNGQDHAGEPLGYGEPAWFGMALRTRQGNLQNHIHNASLALGADPSFDGLLRLDRMTVRTVLPRHAPDQVKPDPEGEFPRPITERDVTAIHCKLITLGLRSISRETVIHAIEDIARRNAFHPVRDYLGGLAWDGEPRLHNWLQTYLGCEHDAYSQIVGPKFLIAMVARVYEPGCKADYMPVLEGPQGTGKSSACRVLAGQWFSDSLPELHRGDPVRLSMAVRGKWVIEVSEMSAIRAAEASALKAFLTQTEEQFVPKFGRVEVHEPRQCLFIGTTNKSAYLGDETGGRRFWPLKTSLIDLPALARDRDQLFAEAVDRYLRGEPWHPSRDEELAHITPQQAQRFQADDAWQDAIEAWINERPGLTHVTVGSLAAHAIGLEKQRTGTIEQRRIVAILEHLGWTRGKRTMHGQPWLRPQILTI